MAAGRFPNVAWALRDFAWHYNGYSEWFPRYLRAVIRRLEEPQHRRLLAENLAEEKGRLDDEERSTLLEIGIDPETVAGIPHSELFQQFCQAVGLDRTTLATTTAATEQWRTRFLTFLRGASPAAAVGALGLGTEGIVSHIYRPILDGIRADGSVQRSDYVFFELHCYVDDQHQQDLFEIAVDLASTPQGRDDLRRGMLTALNLRSEFWDHLFRRAVRSPEVASA
jgi:pyrroloquinoline quinone (PQQ) biosynthesis protein C